MQIPTFFSRCGLAIDIVIQMIFARLLDWIFQTKEFGSSGMTISAQLGKLQLVKNSRACKVCKLLNKLFREQDHCASSLTKWEEK